VRIFACTVLAAALVSPACARRDIPYRFRAPLVSGVRAEPLPERASGLAASGPDAPLPGPARPARPDPARAWLSAPPHARGMRDAHAPAAQTPEPTAEAGAAVAAVEPSLIPRALRDRVGSSARGTSAGFALATLAELGAHLDARVRQATSGAHVLDLARDRDAVLAEEPPLTGDLVVLAGERQRVGDQDLLLGIVIMPADDDRLLELVYAEDGAVRHGVIAQQTCSGRGERVPATARCLTRDRVRAYLALDRLAP
jgi:hypothetical protein